MNSYVTIEEANEYFKTRINSNWDSYDETQKQNLLIHATKLIDTLNFKGERSTQTQPLKFPRKNVYYDGMLLPSNKVPQQVKDAVCEFCIILPTNDYTAVDELASLESVKIDVLEIKTKSDTQIKTSAFSDFPPMVMALLSNFISNQLRLVKA